MKAASPFEQRHHGRFMKISLSVTFFLCLLLLQAIQGARADSWQAVPLPPGGRVEGLLEAGGSLFAVGAAADSVRLNSGSSVWGDWSRGIPYSAATSRQSFSGNSGSLFQLIRSDRAEVRVYERSVNAPTWIFIYDAPVAAEGLHVSATGVVYVWRSNEVFRRQGANWITFAFSSNSILVRDIVSDPSGALYAGTNDGIWKLLPTATTWQRFSLPSRDVSSVVFGTRLHATWTEQGAVCVGSYSTLSGTVDCRVVGEGPLFATSSDALYYFAFGSVFRLNGNTPTIIGTPLGRVTDISGAGAGIAVSTTRGVNVYLSDAYVDRAPMHLRDIRDIYTFGGNNFYVASWGDGVLLPNGSVWRPELASLRGDQPCALLVESRPGALLFTSVSEGLAFQASWPELSNPVVSTGLSANSDCRRHGYRALAGIAGGGNNRIAIQGDANNWVTTNTLINFEIGRVSYETVCTITFCIHTVKQNDQTVWVESGVINVGYRMFRGDYSGYAFIKAQFGGDVLMVKNWNAPSFTQVPLAQFGCPYAYDLAIRSKLLIACGNAGVLELDVPNSTSRMISAGLNGRPIIRLLEEYAIAPGRAFELCEDCIFKYGLESGEVRE